MYITVKRDKFLPGYLTYDGNQFYSDSNHSKGYMIEKKGERYIPMRGSQFSIDSFLPPVVC